MRGAGKRAHVYKSPIEVVRGGRAARLRDVVLSVALGAVVALVLGSKALLAWANGLPIGPTSDFILYWAQLWDDALSALGVATFAEALRDAFHRFLAWRF